MEQTVRVFTLYYVESTYIYLLDINHIIILYNIHRYMCDGKLRNTQTVCSICAEYNLDLQMNELNFPYTFQGLLTRLSPLHGSRNVVTLFAL